MSNQPTIEEIVRNIKKYRKGRLKPALSATIDIKRMDSIVSHLATHDSSMHFLKPSAQLDTILLVLEKMLIEHDGMDSFIDDPENI